MAADSAVMVIDASKGVEAQTRKLFKVCVMRHIPIFTFINKMDRDANDTFDLIDEIEKELGIATCPVNWPIGSGKVFRGVYDRQAGRVLTFSDTKKGTQEGIGEQIALDDPHLLDVLAPDQKETLLEEIDLLDGASAEFDQNLVDQGKLSPVFFGSALTNFGVETFLKHFLSMTAPPLPRVSDAGTIDSMDDDFSAFVFKIQANMNKAHRDRLAFLRVCSGRFDSSEEVYHVQGNRKMRLSQPQQINSEITEYLNKSFGEAYGLEVLDASIVDVHPDEKLKEAINNRVTALQKKQQAQAEQETVKVEAETALIKAKNEAEIKVTEAQAEAKANKVKAESITDELIRMEEAEARKEHGWVTVQGAESVIATE